jgi:hypothetical protein
MVKRKHGEESLLWVLEEAESGENVVEVAGSSGPASGCSP